MFRIPIVLCAALGLSSSVGIPFGFGGAEKFGAGGFGGAPVYEGIGKFGGAGGFGGGGGGYGGIEGGAGFGAGGPGFKYGGVGGGIAAPGIGFEGAKLGGINEGFKYGGGAGIGGFEGAGIGGGIGAGIAAPGISYGGPKLGYAGGAGFAGPRIGAAGIAGPKLGGAGFVGPIAFEGAGIGIGGGGIGGGGIGGAGIGGGEYVNKNIYGGGKKDLKDFKFEASNGKKGEEFEESAEGFNKGKIGAKDVKVDSGFYADEGSGKKLAESGKEYSGGQHFNKEGKSGLEKKVKQGHRKGHVVKGFKTSHHKDEDGKTEEYYDEAHDEGENFGVDGKSGSFGEAEQSSFKGAHEDGEFKANQGKKHGKYDAEHFVDKNNGEGGQFGSKKYGGSRSAYGVDSGIGEESLKGEKEDSKFIKHKPFYF